METKKIAKKIFRAYNRLCKIEVFNLEEYFNCVEDLNPHTEIYRTQPIWEEGYKNISNKKHLLQFTVVGKNFTICFRQRPHGEGRDDVVIYFW